MGRRKLKRTLNEFRQKLDKIYATSKTADDVVTATLQLESIRRTLPFKIETDLIYNYLKNCQANTIREALQQVQDLQIQIRENTQLAEECVKEIEEDKHYGITLEYAIDALLTIETKMRNFLIQKIQ